MMERRPELTIIAGPNGAGKSRLCPLYVSTASFDERTLPIHPLQQLESLGEEGCRVTLHVMMNNELRQELAFYGDHLHIER